MKSVYREIEHAKCYLRILGEADLTGHEDAIAQTLAHLTNAVEALRQAHEDANESE